MSVGKDVPTSILTTFNSKQASTSLVYSSCLPKLTFTLAHARDPASRSPLDSPSPLTPSPEYITLPWIQKSTTCFEQAESFDFELEEEDQNENETGGEFNNWKESLDFGLLTCGFGISTLVEDVSEVQQKILDGEDAYTPFVEERKRIADEDEMDWDLDSYIDDALRDSY